ncbi:hypothetical protein PENTCL1PPCAC_15750, partial [Pristionchus entomophagus]
GNFFSYPDSRTVQTSYGKVRGRRLIYEGDKQVDAFQGIPFAKPPLGELRFKKPQPPASWDGIRDTKAFSKRPIQSRIHWIEYFLKALTSEDCLYLNVFTPCWEPPKNGFPVMVYLFPGGFEMGDTQHYGDKNICEHLITRDVIFVTVAYRLGFLGFFTTGDDECRGNAGLWDQVAALRWINENIEAFGGDKHNITLLGQSAGAVSTDMLHLSPHSTGLFHKMIMMAGNSEIEIVKNKYAPQHCKEKATRLGVTEYNNSKDMLDQLRLLPAKEFAVSIKMFEPEPKKLVEFETVPFIDGDFFPEPLDELRKKAIPKPMISGVTKEEGLLFLLDKKPSEKLLDEAIDLASSQSANRKELAKELRSFYATEAVLADEENLMRAIANVMSDCLMNVPLLELCRKTVAAQKKPLYLYTFDHYNPSVVGICAQHLPIQDTTHSAELLYLFNKNIFFGSLKLTDEDSVLMEAFTSAFVNFAKYGDPNGSDPRKSDLPEWSPVEERNLQRNYVFKGGKCLMDDVFMEGRTGKIIEIMARHRSS